MDKFWRGGAPLVITTLLMAIIVFVISRPSREKAPAQNGQGYAMTVEGKEEIIRKNYAAIAHAEEVRKTDRLRIEEEVRKQERDHALQMVNAPFDPSSCGNLWDVVNYTDRYAELSQVVKKYETSQDSELAAFAKNLRQKLVSHQLKTFPILRREFAKKLGEDLWRQDDSPLLNDVEVNIGGDRNQYLYLTWAGFQLNANIKYCQRAIYQKLHTLRFTQSRYCGFYKFDYEYAFNVFEGKDSDI